MENLCPTGRACWANAPHSSCGGGARHLASRGPALGPPAPANRLGLRQSRLGLHTLQELPGTATDP
eukprot:9573062-Lingulodinium_polyedra.AAC.1